MQPESTLNIYEAVWSHLAIYSYFHVTRQHCTSGTHPRPLNPAPRSPTQPLHPTPVPALTRISTAVPPLLPSCYPRAPLPPVDRSGQSVKTDAAKYVTYHDAKGIGAFLDADLDDLTSVLSFTVDYLAGPSRTLTISPVCVLACVFFAAARGLACWCAWCTWRAWCLRAPLREGSKWARNRMWWEGLDGG